jgi:transcriptional regulator with XRE-family HTH domain
MVEQFHEAVRRVRLGRGLTQAELGVSIGFSQSVISQIEHGSINHSSKAKLESLMVELGLPSLESYGITREDGIPGENPISLGYDGIIAYLVPGHDYSYIGRPEGSNLADACRVSVKILSDQANRLKSDVRAAREIYDSFRNSQDGLTIYHDFSRLETKAMSFHLGEEKPAE